jgi:hypothetical protein
MLNKFFAGKAELCQDGAILRMREATWLISDQASDMKKPAIKPARKQIYRSYVSERLRNSRG